MATLRSIRQTVGRQIPGQQPAAMQTYVLSAAAGAATQLVCATLGGQVNAHRGKYVVVNEPASTRKPAELTRAVDSWDPAADTLTIRGALPYTPASGTTIELWDGRFPPTLVDSYINQALDHANGRTYGSMIGDELWAGPHQRELDAPAGMEFLNDVQQLAGIKERLLAGDASEWPSTTSKQFERLGVWTQDLPHTSVVEAPAYEEVELGRWTHLVAVAYNYGDAASLSMGLSSGALTAAACSGRGWKYLAVPAAAAGSVSSVFLQTALRSGGSQARPLSVHQVKLVDEPTAEWSSVKYMLPLGTGGVMLVEPAKWGSRYRMLGGKPHTPLEQDLDEAPVSTEFLTSYATALALLATGTENPDASLAGPWFTMARRAMQAIPNPARRRVR